ncbi:hypothetical protein RUM44_006506 [Polyplax serrata]|uniref:Uncharacterized protein n=1 Tax=Polyplax serrata TaxID=468196 RepID=A0ABR1AK14_POLSC
MSGKKYIPGIYSGSYRAEGENLEGGCGGGGAGDDGREKNAKGYFAPGVPGYPNLLSQPGTRLVAPWPGQTQHCRAPAMSSDTQPNVSEDDNYYNYGRPRKFLLLPLTGFAVDGHFNWNFTGTRHQEEMGSSKKKRTKKKKKRNSPSSRRLFIVDFAREGTSQQILDFAQQLKLGCGFFRFGFTRQQQKNPIRNFSGKKKITFPMSRSGQCGVQKKKKEKEGEWWKKSKKKKLKRKKIRVLPMTGGQASAHKTSLKPSKMEMATVQVEEDEDEERKADVQTDG